MKKYLPAIISSSIGNILEWYDFGLFSIFAPLFSDIFFPTNDPRTALIATFTIFAIGFICRPLGAFLFGYLGDKYGRAGTLRLSILMIALPTILIGILPTYEQVGIFAPCLLLLTRMWQGISIGGEYSGNLIYLAETAPNQQRAFFTSFASTGANLGILLATLVGMLMSQLFKETTLAEYGWRLPYLLSGLLCLFIYKFRLRIEETRVFEYLKAKQKIVANPIKYAFKYNRFELLRTLGLVCMGSTSYYFYFAYVPILLRTSAHYSIYNISLVMSCLFILMIFLVPAAGYLCDLIGRRKLFLFNSFLTITGVTFGMYLLEMHTLILFVLIFFAITSSLEQATTSVSVVENFPPPARYVGLAIAYNVGNGFLGGTAPIICEWLSISVAPFAPVFYIVFCALITTIVVYLYLPETKGVSLTK